HRFLPGPPRRHPLGDAVDRVVRRAVHDRRPLLAAGGVAADPDARSRRARRCGRCGAASGILEAAPGLVRPRRAGAACLSRDLLPDGRQAVMKTWRRAMVDGAAVGAVASVLSTAVLAAASRRSEEHTSELQSRGNLVCRLLL